MSLRWLSSTVGAKFRPGIRRRMAPEARRDLTTEINADVLSIHRVWVRNLIRDPAEGRQPEKTVVAWVEASERAEVAAWLAGPPSDAVAPYEQPEVRTDWIFFPATPEAILIGVVEGAVDATAGAAQPFRFNLRFPADPYRRHLEALARSGELGLAVEPVQVGSVRQIESHCLFVPVKTGPLRTFLRDQAAEPRRSC